ncbi:MAG: helix-turn-helix transcriptional regulator [Alphaproteobacteria bacterium]|nr:helix-turn-helix transcriptional regulator [Alphaproteobacteria bacterium]
MSQTVLGDEIDFSFKQMQKYESGTNRFGAGRLYEISVALDTDGERFFDGAPGFASTHQPPDEIAAIAMDRECEKLVTAYYEFPIHNSVRRSSTYRGRFPKTSNVPNSCKPVDSEPFHTL